MGLSGYISKRPKYKPAGQVNKCGNTWINSVKSCEIVRLRDTIDVNGCPVTSQKSQTCLGIIATRGSKQGQK
jgi:hypothetical protein